MTTENMIRKLMDDYHVAGMSVALIRGGEIVSTEGYGLRDAAAELPMTADTVMPIGSITKTFTALALGMLADEGKLDWDAPVITYIPSLKLSSALLTENVTTRDLMCHRTGVPKYDLQAIYCVMEDSKEMVRSLEYLEANAAFRTKLQYSNQMVSLAGYLIEVISGIPYQEFVRERIFKPLGMQSTDFEAASLAKYENTSKGYVFANGTFIEPPYMHLGAFAPSGAIVSTASDMAKYALFCLNGGTATGQRLISEESLRQMQSPQVIGTPYFWNFEEFQSTEYGLGWFTDIYRGVKMIGHGGNTNGFSAQMTLLPAQNAAIVALSNATSSFSVNALGHVFADETLGVTDIPDWSGRFQEIFNNLMAGMMASMQARAEAKVPDTTPSRELADYAGTYRHPGFGEMQFDMTEQGLAGTWNGLPAMLIHYNYDEFDLMLPVLGQAVPARFTVGDGIIHGLQVTMETAPGIKPAVFEKVR
ncbi:MAG: serine hydrolase [Lachnospiraceae bacterium]|nr:serine hydrolase [Lachnospiraceae bacterium]